VLAGLLRSANAPSDALMGTTTTWRGNLWETGLARVNGIGDLFNHAIERLIASASWHSRGRAKECIEMNGRRLILMLGAILFVAGVIGLFVPVSISGGIGCGNAVHSDVSAARAQDNQNIGNSPVVQQIPIANQLAPKSQFVSECNSALGNRRLWTIPLTVIGVAIAGGAFVRRPQAHASGI
jgi:hypothetical protein